MDIYNIAVIGSHGVGKSALAATFVDDRASYPFEGRIPPDFRIKCIKINDKDIKIRLWEIRYIETQIKDNIDALKRYNGIILCYDITNHSTYETIINCIKLINDKYPHIPKVLIGTASDLIDESSEDYLVPVNNLIRNEHTGYFEDIKITYIKASPVQKIHAETLASEYNMPFYETSARNNINVQESIMNLIHRINLNYPKIIPEIIVAEDKNINKTCTIS
jgi:GTPase SAR1 family protein